MSLSLDSSGWHRFLGLAPVLVSASRIEAVLGGGLAGYLQRPNRFLESAALDVPAMGDNCACKRCQEIMMLCAACISTAYDAR